MKNFTAVLTLLLLTAFLAACAKEIPTDQKSRPTYLFIVVVNGVRYDDALGNSNHLYTDNIWNKLRPLGTICTKFYNRELTYPIPAQMSLLTGVWHVLENPLSETIRPAFPTLFEYWKKIKTNDSCYFASSKKKLEILTYSNHTEYGKTYAPEFETNASTSVDTMLKEGETEVIEDAIYEKAIVNIFKRHPPFVYVNLGSGRGDEYARSAHECRLPGQKDACGGSDLLNAYYESIILFDSIVFDLWDRVQHDETYKEKSIFIVVSDHGRHTDDFHGFGDKCRGCQQLNFLVIGPGIKKNFISKKERTLIDICPTVGTLFNMPTPFAKGKVMKELLE
ncbi:MAG TPA: sulfatase-like hydrolase/transferase [Chitinivibrionales bacterium]